MQHEYKLLVGFVKSDFVSNFNFNCAGEYIYATVGFETDCVGFHFCFDSAQWKKNSIRHFARFNFSRLSLAFISKYYPILHLVKR